jgi:plasmid stability protein
MLLAMAKTIQVRDVPDAVHRRLKQRAADAGMSLSEHLLAELVRLSALPIRKEWRERLHAGGVVKLTRSAAALVRRERGAARS